MLKLKDIHTHYGNIECLKGISLEVKEGEIVTLLGANGAGKSTTLMAISGIIKPSRGTIEFLGEDISRLAPHIIVRKGISQVPEGRRVFPKLDVTENLDMGGFIRTDRKEINRDKEEVFSLFPALKERARQIAGTLSGGEQQMLAIGRALMARPKLLLLDEPSLGLAPMLVETIFNCLIALKERGATILLVEQNAHMALKIAERGYILETGRLVLSGMAKEILNNEMVKKAYLGE